MLQVRRHQEVSKKYERQKYRRVSQRDDCSSMGHIIRRDENGKEKSWPRVNVIEENRGYDANAKQWENQATENERKRQPRMYEISRRRKEDGTIPCF